MKLVFNILTAVCVFASLSVRAEDCKHRLFFLPQSHDVEGIPNAELVASARQEVAASQLKIANYLDRFLQRAVFSEQATTADLDVSQLSPEILAQLKVMINGIFPKGYNLNPHPRSACSCRLNS